MIIESDVDENIYTGYLTSVVHLMQLGVVYSTPRPID